MLEITDLRVSYGPVEALRGVSLVARSGMTTAILGANGAGKSSLLRAISGLAPIRGGRVLLDGMDITTVAAHRRARLGLAHAMEGRRLFRQLAVEDNLRLSWSFGRRVIPLPQALQTVYEQFPPLAEKRRTPAGLLSGGQQQMMVLSCATIRSPQYLLLDEPSLGLAPVVITQIYNYIMGYARRSGTAIIIAEQMAALALKVSDHAYVLRRGRIGLQGESRELLSGTAGDTLSSAYL